MNQSFITGASNPGGIAGYRAFINRANAATGPIGRAQLNGNGATQSFIPGAGTPLGMYVG